MSFPQVRCVAGWCRNSFRSKPGVFQPVVRPSPMLRRGLNGGSTVAFAPFNHRPQGPGLGRTSRSAYGSFLSQRSSLLPTGTEANPLRTSVGTTLFTCETRVIDKPLPAIYSVKPGFVRLSFIFVVPFRPLISVRERLRI